MKPPPAGAARSLIAATAGIALTALVLRLLPGLADTATRHASPMIGEALFTLIVFGPLIAVAAAGGWLTELRPLQPGVAARREGALGAGLGIGGLLLAAAYAAIAGVARSGGHALPGLALALGLFVVGVQVLAEESVFRGWLQPLLGRVVGLPSAIIVQAVAFALLHLLAGAHGLVAVLNLLLGGLLFGLLAARGHGIAGAFAAHFGWNASEQLLLGLDPNPGVGAFGSLFDLDLVGAVRWGGSVDGLNASWAMTWALVTVTAPLLVLSRKRGSA